MGEAAFEAANTAGWDRNYDGGTKLVALQALQHVDKEKTRDLAYQSLASDLIEKDWMWLNIARSYDEI